MIISGQIKKRLKEEKGYLQYTDYHKLPGGLKKLDFIIETILEHETKKLKGKDKDFIILEVGCGNGNLLISIASMGYEVVGLDIDSDSIAYARSINQFPNARFELVGENSWDLKEKFDVIICSEVLEHLLEPSKLLRLMISVLKNDGILIITVPNGYGPREVLGRLEKYLRINLELDKYVDVARKLMGMIPAKVKCQIHTSNPDQEHVQKFTQSSIKHLMLKNGLLVSKNRNSFLLFSVFGRYNDSRSILDYLDCKIADCLPSSIVSGWYFICKKIFVIWLMSWASELEIPFYCLI